MLLVCVRSVFSDIDSSRAMTGPSRSDPSSRSYVVSSRVVALWSI